ncbi:MAG: acyl-CoA dehydrogenase, partial [Pseudomonadota bacterium]|nr:acyl-CoA dehydrogenase [Pseudomonadota bacterium]
MAQYAVDQDPQLSEVERAAWDTAHRFARDIMRPAGQALDKLSADAVIARDSILWDVFRAYRELGLGLFEEGSDLPLEMQARLRCLIGEEMGWGDSGLAISLGVAGFPTLMAQMVGNEAMLERFPAGTLGC